MVVVVGSVTTQWLAESAYEQNALLPYVYKVGKKWEYVFSMWTTIITA